MAEDRGGMLVEIGLTEKQYLAALKRIEASTVNAAKKSETSFKGANTQVQRIGQTSGKSAYALRMVGVQLGQVGQQASVMGGGIDKWARALSVQLPDMLMFMGGIGIAAGVASSVLAPMVLNLFSAGKAADDAQKMLSELGALTLDQSRSAIKELTDLQEAYTAAIETAARTKSAESMAAVEGIGREYEARRALLELQKVETDNRLRSLKVLRDQQQREFEGMVADAQRLAEASTHIGPGDPEGMRRYNEAVAQAILIMVDANQELVGGMKQTTAEIDLTQLSAEDLAAALSSSADFASLIEGADMQGGVAAAAVEAERLAAALGIALSSALAIANSTPTMLDEDSAMSVPVLSSADGREQNRRAVASMFKAIEPKSGGGGGGGGSSDANSRLREAERLFNETRTAAEKYADELERIEGLYADGLISQDTYTRALDDLKEQLNDIPDIAKKAGSAIAGALDLRSLASDPAKVLEDLAWQLAQIAFQASLAKAFPSLFGAGGFAPLASANGNAFSGGRVLPFAKGGVVSGPTLFPMANGAGLMGEAGPEAILPLSRLGNGKLGVLAQGSGSGGTVVQVVNTTGAPVREERSNGPDGRELVRIVVGEEFGRGAFDKQQNGRYGVTPRKVKR